MKIPKQEYTAEFKELAVKRVKAGLSAGAVAKNLGLIEQTLRNWLFGISPYFLTIWNLIIGGFRNEVQF